MKLIRSYIENDSFFPDDIRNEGLKYLQANNIEHEMRVYEGVPHGSYLLCLYHLDPVILTVYRVWGLWKLLRGTYKDCTKAGLSAVSSVYGQTLRNKGYISIQACIVGYASQ